jgi:hypothetical protein
MSPDPRERDVVARMGHVLAAAGSPLDDSLVSRMAATFDLLTADFSAPTITRHFDAARACARRERLTATDILLGR